MASEDPTVHQHLHVYQAPEQPPLQYAPEGQLLVYDTRPQANPMWWYVFLLICCGPPGWALLALIVVFKVLAAIFRPRH